jgi:hypothetical protein
MISQDDRISARLRGAFPLPQTKAPSRDLWPSVAARLEQADQARRWSWIDVGLAACAAGALLAVPGSFALIAYHL